MKGTDWIKVFRKKSDVELKSISLNISRIEEACQGAGMREITEEFSLWGMNTLGSFVFDVMKERRKEQSPPAATQDTGLTGNTGSVPVSNNAG